MMGLRVFVTRELFPFTAGGIGRVVANILMTTPEDERARICVLYVGDDVQASAFSVAHPGIKLFLWPHSCFQRTGRDGEQYPPMPAFDHSMLHWESVHVLQGLLELQRKHGDLDYVEFVDWGAPAFACTQEKLLDRAFRTTTLAVRLHTTDSLLADFEPRVQSIHGLSLYDLERKALADCDLIVGQVAPVAEAFRTFYGFSEQDWSPRLHLHAPPVLLDSVPNATRVIHVDDNTPLLFTSKLQDIKRPDSFVRGCVQFMRARPSYRGDVVFLAHSFDAGYQDYIQGMIPHDLRERVVFAPGLPGRIREQRIAGSVCVFPSPWESFCLAAYEAALSGSACVMNKLNPAFGPGSPWRDGENCRTFDGSAEDLADVLINLFETSTGDMTPVKVPVDPRPWELAAPDAAPSPSLSPADEDAAALTVVVVNRNSGGALLGTIESILASNVLVSRLIVVDDASNDPRDQAVLRRLERGAQSFQLLTREVAIGESAARNLGLAAVDTPLVAFVRAGDRVMPGFLATAAKALSTHTAYDVVVGQTGVTAVAKDVIKGQGSIDSYRVYYGEARLAGLYENRLAPETYVIRTSAARRFAFDPVMPAFEVWETMLRACQAGSRFIVTSAVNVLVSYQAPAENEYPQRLEVASRRRLQRKRARLGELEVPAYYVAGVAQFNHVGVGDSNQAHLAFRLQELLESETVRYTLALANLLHKRAPWTLRFGKWLARRLAPLYHRVR